jgi:UDP-N-acetylmuramoyl-L-alanyl-D-glutamate--2,6-diaminopimelate ligase
MRLSELVQPLGALLFSTDPAGADPEISGLEYDSRRVARGSAFFAVTGYRQDGRKYVPQALDKGAAAIVSREPEDTGGAVLVRVANVRRAMALMAAAFHGYPSQDMETVAITGTAGKTTTSYLLRSILEAYGRKTGLVGTIRYLIGEEVHEAPNTTPESLDLQRLLHAMRQKGVQAVVMEASSHGIELDRVAGIAFRAAVFTNFSQDHLDFHGTMEEYYRAKRRLFENLPDTAKAVANIDDPKGQDILAASRAVGIGYGLSEKAGVRAAILSSGMAGTNFELSAFGRTATVDLKLAGLHNVYNALAAAGAAWSLDVPLEAVKRGLEQVASVDGRMEKVDLGQDFTVLVDYAHTPEELERLMQAVRGLGPRRIITVFGCGGDRDRTKRPLMGRAAASASDLSIVTSDNPRTEDPQAIIGDILPGVSGYEHLVIPDRRQAIRRAVELAGSGDAVVIAGKGHEDYQIIGTTKTHFDDREEARAAIEHRMKRR